jgi:hypothetical protein
MFQGHSVRIDVPGTLSLAGSDLNGQIVVETLVREQVIYVEIKSTMDLTDERRIVDYKVVRFDGRPLPWWVRQAHKGLLLLEVPAEGGQLDLRITAMHANGETTEKSVKLQLATGDVQNLVTIGPQPGSTFDSQLRSQFEGIQDNLNAIKQGISN